MGRTRWAGAAETTAVGNIRMRAVALYVGRLRRSRLRAELHTRMSKRVAESYRGGWIVDVGCGPGLLGQRIASLLPTARIVNVDVDPRMAHIARHETHGDVVLATSTSLPFRSGAVAVVVSSASVKDWGDRAGGLREVRRVLGTGGIGVVLEFVTSGPGSAPQGFRLRFGIVSDILRRLSGLVIPFSVADARRLAEAVGGELAVEADLGVVRVTLGPA